MAASAPDSHTGCSGKLFSEKHIALLNALRHASYRQRVALLKAADRDLIRCICECALNVLRGVVTLESSQVKRLKRYRNTLRELIKKPAGKAAHSWTGKKRKIVQSGGAFLPILLSSVLSAVISNIIERKKQ
ncbi:hypothetical protein QAD02_008388 [Eretmocerus hayati]|uniref:Uncharacterized protein n=1 Tax=Eretmocerus hayati TaxID=131215 RepID=A0ACC2N6L3_9HYME|nr:hypothetical protein QAD02_008388 [Eretmocerus hayati]